MPKKSKDTKQKDPLIWIKLSSPRKLLRAFCTSFICIFTIYCFMRYEPSRHGVWFSDITDPVILSEAEMGALIRQTVDGVFNGKFKRANLRSLREDRRPRIVFLSVSDGESAAKVVFGRGKGITIALENAIRKSRKPETRVFNPKWVKVDVVQQASSEPSFQFGTFLSLSRASQGIAFPRQTQLAFLPEELVAYSLVDKDKKVISGNIKRYLASNSEALERFKKLDPKGSFEAYWFSTLSFFTDGEKYVELKEGKRDEKSASSSVEESVRLAVEYLTQTMNTSGRFLSSFTPGKEVSNFDYDLYFHANTLWTLLDFYEVTKDPDLLRKAQSGANFIFQSSLNSLGAKGMALAVVSKLSRISPSSTYSEFIKSLGIKLTAEQEQSGKFRQNTNEKGRTDEYAGAAVFGLWQLHLATNTKRWFKAADKGARYLILKRDRNLPDARLLPDRWLVRTLSGMFQAKRDPLFLTHVQRIAGAIAASQNRNQLFPTWRGSFFRPPQTLETGKRADVLCTTYELVGKVGNPEVARKLRESVKLAAGFQMRSQFLPESVLYVDRPDRSLGGFRRGLSDYEISLENVQANLGSLVCYYRQIR